MSSRKLSEQEEMQLVKEYEQGAKLILNLWHILLA